MPEPRLPVRPRVDESHDMGCVCESCGAQVRIYHHDELLRPFDEVPSGAAQARIRFTDPRCPKCGANLRGVMVDLLDENEPMVDLS